MYNSISVTIVGISCTQLKLGNLHANFHKCKGTISNNYCHLKNYQILLLAVCKPLLGTIVRCPSSTSRHFSTKRRRYHIVSIPVTYVRKFIDTLDAVKNNDDARSAITCTLGYILPLIGSSSRNPPSESVSYSMYLHTYISCCMLALLHVRK